MTVHLAAFGATGGDRRGYRWLWRDDSLSDASLNQILPRLDTARLSDAGQLRKLLAGELDAGVLAVAEDNCVAYRFLHGGRDGAREKFHLQIGVLPRRDLARLDLLALLKHPAFAVVQESRPGGTIMDLPIRTGPPLNEPVPADSLSRCWGECSALPPARPFHLRLTGLASAPLAELRVAQPAISALPAIGTSQAPSVTTHPPAANAALPSTAPEARPLTHRRFTVVAFLLGLLVGLLLGRGCARSSKAADSEPRSARPSATERPSLLDSNREPARAATAPEMVTPKDSPGIKPQGAKPH